MISAQEAYRIGLVNEVVPAADLISRAEAILNEIAANAPLAVRYALDAVNKGMETSQSEGFALEASYFGLCAGTEDKKEGTSAFLRSARHNFTVADPVGRSARESHINQGATNAQTKTFFSGLKVRGSVELHRGSQRRRDPVRLRRRRHQGRAAAAATRGDMGTRYRPQPRAEGRLSVASRQPQQARHHARSEIAERTAGLSRSSSTGPTCSIVNTPHPCAQEAEARI